MRKAFVGVRLKRLREERGLSQVALARALELSASYLNQLERNQRPLTVPVLLKLNAVFGLDVQAFSEDGEARMMTDLKTILSEAGGREPVSQAEIRELAANMPAVARRIVELDRRFREVSERVEALSARLGEGTKGEAQMTTPMPFEEVRDFFYERRNHIPALDAAAEAIFAEEKLPIGAMAEGLAARLKAHHAIDVIMTDMGGEGTLRAYDPARRQLRLSARLRLGQQAFQMATQIGFLEAGETIDRLAAEAAFLSDEARRLARIGLAAYFAGALVMPYGPFLAAAEAVSYDIDLIGGRFDVGFETVCHRLSTLQRPAARGVPFFFIRVDRAGNISKRQSAADFHFSRIGGNCPLWNVYGAFARPGTILTQVAQMPDGRRFLWIARTVSRGRGGFGAPQKTFAVALGCDLQHADRLVYSQGLDLTNPAAATPIGAGCKLCERKACLQRAFPALSRALETDENTSRFAPYSGTSSEE